MATVRWLGTDDAVAQVTAGAIASLDATPGNNTFTITIGGVAVSVAGVTNVATTAAALVAAATASAHPYFAAVTWANPSSGNITGTAKTAGIPFIATLTKTGAGTGTVTAFSDTTANAGPNVVSAANFSGGALPSNGDTLIIELGSVPMLWKLDALAAVTFAEIRVPMNYTGLCGLDETQFCTAVTGTEQTYSTTRKAEYRQCYLQVSTTTLFNYGLGEGAGAARFKIDFQTTAFTARVFNTCSSSKDPNLEPLRIKSTNTGNILYTHGGSVGVARSLGTETSKVSSVYSYGGKVRLAAGVDWATLNPRGGEIFADQVPSSGTMAIIATGGLCQVESSQGTIASVTARSGKARVRVNGSCAITDAAVYGDAILYYNTSGQLNNLALDEGGTLDGSESNVARTIQNAIDVGLGTLIVNPQIVTINSGLVLTSNGNVKLTTQAA